MLRASVGRWREGLARGEQAGGEIASQTLLALLERQEAIYNPPRQRNAARHHETYRQRLLARRHDPRAQPAETMRRQVTAIRTSAARGRVFTDACPYRAPDDGLRGLARTPSHHANEHETSRSERALDQPVRRERRVGERRPIETEGGQVHRMCRRIPRRQLGQDAPERRCELEPVRRPERDEPFSCPGTASITKSRSGVSV